MMIYQQDNSQDILLTRSGNTGIADLGWTLKSDLEANVRNPED